MTSLLTLRPADPRSALSGLRRERDLAWLADGGHVDVLVIGAGVTGCGVALDAATRGLSVAVVERADLANGTSRWSSKLVHGGLRYLAYGDVGIAFESARERGVLMERVAPHLVRPLPMLVPLTPAVTTGRATQTRVAQYVGHLLSRAARTPRRTVPAPRKVGRAEALRLAGGLRADGLRGGLVHWEGQLEDDARLVVALARTAAAYGARVVTYATALSVAAGHVALRDERSGQTFEIHARRVVNATGVWADELDPQVRLRPSKGSHLVVRSAALRDPAVALSVPVPGEPHRFALVLPQPDGLSYIGLTDAPQPGPVPDHATVSDAEQAFLLDVANSVVDQPLDDSDVVGGFSGFRPLLDAPGRTVDLSRRHAVHDSGEGLLTVTGGKLTTYRRMACDVVDRVTDRPCRTDRVALVGAGPSTVPGTRDVAARLVRRFGAEAAAVAALADTDPVLAEPLAPGVPVLGVEVAWAQAHEGALTVEDVLARRTRLALVPADAASARTTVEHIMSGWSAQQMGQDRAG